MKLTGWLFDIYPNEQDGITLWLIADDGERHCLQHKFPVTFYAAGPSARLRSLWQYLNRQDVPVRLSRTERRDLFAGQTVVLACEVTNPSALYGLFERVFQSFPDLTYYDADIHLALRYAAVFDVFPLARCEVEVLGSQVQSIQPLDTRWDLDPLPAPLRILSLEPDTDPSHRDPTGIIFQYERCRYRFPLEPARAVLVNLRTILDRYNPDLILTSHGDSWLIPWLIGKAKELGLPLPLNRDPSRDILTRKEHSYFSYGKIVYRGQQSQLFGRWHLDRHNAMLWSDYELEGVLEMARVTCLPVQEAARLSPGTGISSMQFVTALQKGILIPWHKAQAEKPKTALELIRADMGGMVYQPTIGLHENVIGIDFVSMYPGIMVHFNISPEVPRSGQTLEPSTEEPGLVPLTLEPLLRKRIAYKSALFEMQRWYARREKYKARSSAEKWLLVTCFGYLGYKNARFGRIESHEAVTEYGREALLRAKEAAEDLGFEILHLYVDGLWVKKATKPDQAEIKELLEEIVDRTGLPIALDGIYRWIAFLPSRQNNKVPVANRYFGVFQDGSIKVRGIECRRRDTPAFISKTQMGILEILAQAKDANSLAGYFPAVERFVTKQERALREYHVPLEDLVLRQRLSRELTAYKTPSPAARAAQQLSRIGKEIRPGQSVRFIYTLGKVGVHAWDLPTLPSPKATDISRYMVLLNRAVEAIMQQVALSSVIAAPTELFVKSESRQCYPISELSYDVKN
jgi:DNA polymerase-2